MHLWICMPWSGPEELIKIHYWSSAGKVVLSLPHKVVDTWWLEAKSLAQGWSYKGPPLGSQQTGETWLFLLITNLFTIKLPSCAKNLQLSNFHLKIIYTYHLEQKIIHKEPEQGYSQQRSEMFFSPNRMIFWPKKEKDHLLQGMCGGKHKLMFTIPSNWCLSWRSSISKHTLYLSFIYTYKTSPKEWDFRNSTISMSKVVRSIQCDIIFKHRNLEILWNLWVAQAHSSLCLNKTT